MSIKWFYKSLPFLIALVFGTVTYLIGLNLNDNLKSLTHNISAAFIAIPFLYYIYEISKMFSERKLNKEIFDYIKMQVDGEVLSVINQLMKSLYTYDNHDFSNKGINDFLSLNKSTLQSHIDNNKHLGFQVLKQWGSNETKLHELLKNTLLLNHIGNEQLIAIIKIIKSIRDIEHFQKANDMYFQSEEVNEKYLTIKGTEINEDNIEFPNRYILLEKIDGNKSIVKDFGDFEHYKKDNMLKTYTLNKKYKTYYIESIFEFITNINIWLQCSGNEFIIDTKHFRQAIHPDNPTNTP